MRLFKRLLVYSAIFVIIIKLPSIINNTSTCINCMGKKPSFHHYWQNTGIRFIEAMCYKDNQYNLKILNEYRIALQDTVWGLYGISFLDNTEKFPNQSWSDEQDWEYINKESTFISFNVNAKNKTIKDIFFRRKSIMGSHNVKYLINGIKENSTRDKVINILGDHKSVDIQTLESFYSWCTKQKYHEDVDTCRYYLRSDKRSESDIIITYIEKGVFFYLHIN